MGYYFRAFCRSTESPAFSQLQKFMHSKNPHYRLEGEVDDNNSYWTDFIFHYKEGRLPILVEINWCDDDSSLGKEELEEFLEDIGRPGLSLKKRKVIKHLKATKYIVCCQIPSSDVDKDGFSANHLLMDFFIHHYQAMIHADNEGYYNNDNTLLLKEE
jgi:hypothetical protein